jgi:hypothetical protein
MLSAAQESPHVNVAGSANCEGQYLAGKGDVSGAQ